MRALGYARVSTGEQAEDGSSLETQEAACRAYCAEKGYAVVGVYRDTHTGSEWRERPGLTALRERLASERGPWVVVAHALDRVSRQQLHLAVLVDLLEAHDARLELVTEAFEDSATGRFIRNAKAFAAEVELEKNRERTTRGMLRYMQSGKRVPGRVPAYGLRWLDETRQGAEEDPQIADVVRRIFQMAADGASLLEVARTLTSEGVPSPTGRAAWQSSSVAFILKNPMYLGQVFARRWQHGRKRGRWFQIERPADERIPLPDWPCEPLIDPATWADAQDTLARNKLTRRVRSAPDAFLLRGGFVLCGACGHPLSCQRGRRYDYYRCQVPQRDPGRCSEPVYVRSSELDAAVWEGDERWPGVAHVVPVLAETLGASPPPQPTPIDRSAREVQRVQSEAAALRRALARTDDPLVSDGILADLTKLAQRERTLRASAPPPASAPLDVEEIAVAIAQATTYAEKRRILARLQITVRVSRHPSRVRGRTPEYAVTCGLLPPSD